MQKDLKREEVLEMTIEKVVVAESLRVLNTPLLHAPKAALLGISIMRPSSFPPLSVTFPTWPSNGQDLAYIQAPPQRPLLSLQVTAQRHKNLYVRVQHYGMTVSHYDYVYICGCRLSSGL